MQAMLSMLDRQPAQMTKPSIACELCKDLSKCAAWNIKLGSGRIDRCLYEKSTGKQVNILLNNPLIIRSSLFYLLRLA